MPVKATGIGSERQCRQKHAILQGLNYRLLSEGSAVPPLDMYVRAIDNTSVLSGWHEGLSCW